MSRWNGTVTALALLCALQAGLLLGQLLPGEARAQDWRQPEVMAEALHCRTFTASLGEEELSTRDRNSPVGRWIGAHEEEGRRLHQLDFEVGQRHTGYPQGWVHVCMRG